MIAGEGGAEAGEWAMEAEDAGEGRSAEFRGRLGGHGRGARDAGEDECGSAAGEGVAAVGEGGAVATSGERHGFGGRDGAADLGEGRKAIF